MFFMLNIINRKISTSIMHAKAKIMENIPLLGSWCWIEYHFDSKINLGKKKKKNCSQWR